MHESDSPPPGGIVKGRRHFQSNGICVDTGKSAWRNYTPHKSWLEVLQKPGPY